MMIAQLNKLVKEPQNYTLASDLSGAHQYSQAQFQSELHQLRNHLKRFTKQRWLLAFEDPYLFAVGFLALISLNKTVVLSANRTRSWLKEIDQSFEAVLGDDTIASSDKLQVTMGYSQLASLPCIPQDAFEITGNESVVFFTSGSTGKAKEVTKCFSYLIDEVATLEETFGARLENSVIVSSVSHFHIYGLLFNLLWPLLTRRAWLAEIVEYQEQLAKVAEHSDKLTFISSPAFLSRLDQAMPIARLEAIFSSGGPLSFESASSAHNAFGQLPIEVYGSTETGGIGFRTQAKQNQNWELFDKISLEERSGDIYLRSPHIGTGNQLKLDDNVKILGQKAFMLKGRNDRIVKIEEKRIALTEIEEFLISLSSISECACLVLQNKRTFIAAVLVLTDVGRAEIKEKGRLLFLQSLKQTMRTRFENVTIPRKWRIIEELPVNQQSKREYTELTRLFETKT